MIATEDPFHLEIQEVLNAIADLGLRPQLHIDQVRSQCKQWPTLMTALYRLAAAQQPHHRAALILMNAGVQR